MNLLMQQRGTGLGAAFRAVFGSLILITLAACSGGKDAPGENDIKNAVAFTLPAGLEVSDVEILVTENAGSQVEPLIRSRSNITLEFTDDFVVAVEQYDDNVVLKKTYDKGQELKGTLISSGRLQGENWKVSIDKFDIPRIQGSALSQFAAGNYAFEGTDEAAAFRTAYQDRLAQAEAERLAAIEAAKQAKADRIKAFRAALAGTWAATGPLMNNGGVYTGRDRQSTAGIEIIFPEGDSATGVAPITLYVRNDPTDALTVKAGFTVADDGKSVTVNARSNSHKTLNFYFSGNWVMDESGLFKVPGRNSWAIQLEKDGAAVAEKNALFDKLTARAAAIQALAAKHKAGIAPRLFQNLRLNNNTYTNMYVEANPADGARVYGNEEYDDSSDIAATAIHAGILKPGEAGVVKITHRRYKDRPDIQGSVANGITSQRFSAYSRYTIELVEKLAED